MTGPALPAFSGLHRAPDRSIFDSTHPARSIAMYSMYEALARERTQDQLASAAHRRLSRQLADVRRWHRLAAYSAGRAARSERRLAEQLGSDYQLVG
jgi:hypothetical protein